MIYEKNKNAYRKGLFYPEDDTKKIIKYSQKKKHKLGGVYILALLFEIVVRF